MSRIWNHQGQVALQGQLAESHAIDVNRLDSSTGRIIVDNGVLDIAQILRDGTVRLLPHDPSALVTHRMGSGVRWEPDARCPAFERFTAESVADADQRWWLLWRTICALFGRMPRKGFVNLIGETDSGKSTYTAAIAHLAGEYARAVPVETFLAKRGGDQFQAHELMGARFVHTHEPNATALYDVSFMKTLTGREDRMRTRTLYEKPVEWLPQCTPFIGSNNPIRFSTADDAMMSREEVIRFARNYREPDPWLSERLRAERNGILRLLVDHTVAEAALGHVPDLPVTVVVERERMAVQTEDAL
jgi:putative DNA primase/helicase